MKMMYGYVRVSTREQNEARQMRALHDIAVPRENIYMDKQSGKDFERPMYHRMVRRLQEDDVIFVKSIDRLGRNYEEILEQWRFLTNFEQICYQWRSGEIPGKEAARLLSIPLSTFYGRAKEVVSVGECGRMLLE